MKGPSTKVCVIDTNAWWYFKKLWCLFCIFFLSPYLLWFGHVQEDFIVIIFPIFLALVKLYIIFKSKELQNIIEERSHTNRTYIAYWIVALLIFSLSLWKYAEYSHTVFLILAMMEFFMNSMDFFVFGKQTELECEKISESGKSDSSGSYTVKSTDSNDDSKSKPRSNDVKMKCEGGLSTSIPRDQGSAKSFDDDDASLESKPTFRGHGFERNDSGFHGLERNISHRSSKMEGTVNSQDPTDQHRSSFEGRRYDHRKEAKTCVTIHQSIASKSIAQGVNDMVCVSVKSTISYSRSTSVLSNYTHHMDMGEHVDSHTSEDRFALERKHSDSNERELDEDRPSFANIGMMEDVFGVDQETHSRPSKPSKLLSRSHRRQPTAGFDGLIEVPEFSEMSSEEIKAFAQKERRALLLQIKQALAIPQDGTFDHMLKRAQSDRHKLYSRGDFHSAPIVINHYNSSDSTDDSYSEFTTPPSPKISKRKSAPLRRVFYDNSIVRTFE